MHPKNSITPDVTQHPTLSSMVFGDPMMEYTSPLFCVVEGGNLIDGLNAAAHLADGMTQLHMRLHASINDGEIAYCAEVRALAFISEAVCALTRSASRGLQAAAEGEVQQ